jgi:hypothetical protein
VAAAELQAKDTTKTRSIIVADDPVYSTPTQERWLCLLGLTLMLKDRTGDGRALTMSDGVGS